MHDGRRVFWLMRGEENASVDLSGQGARFACGPHRQYHNKELDRFECGTTLEMLSIYFLLQGSGCNVLALIFF